MSGQQLAKVGASTWDWLYRIFLRTGLDWWWMGKAIFRASKLFPQVSWLRHPLIPNAVPDLLTVSISSPIELLHFLKPGKHFNAMFTFYSNSIVKGVLSKLSK